MVNAENPRREVSDFLFIDFSDFNYIFASKSEDRLHFGIKKVNFLFFSQLALTLHRKAKSGCASAIKSNKFALYCTRLARTL